MQILKTFEGYLLNIFLLVLLNTSLLHAISVNSSAPASDIISFWKFDERSGITVFDSSNNQNNGTLFNINPDSARVDGIFNKALRFSFGNGYVLVKHAETLNLNSEDFSICLWVRAEGSGKHLELIRKGSDSTNGHFNISIQNSGRLKVIIGDGINRVSSPDDGMNLLDLKFHHIAVAFDRRGSMTRYIDGIPDGTAMDISVIGNINNTENLYIGGNFYIPFCTIDDVRIYNRVLATKEILNLYLARAPIQKPISTQLHVHGSTSEGLGSWNSGIYDNLFAGVDVVWWSDHDWRTSYYHFTSTFGFEDRTEPIDLNEPWSSIYEEEDLTKKKVNILMEEELKNWFKVYQYKFTDSLAFQGDKSLYMRAIGASNEFQKFYFEVEASRDRFKRSLASNVEIEIAIFPQIISTNGTAAVEICLSHQVLPDPSFMTAASFKLQYYLSNTVKTPSRIDNTYMIPLSFIPDSWNHYVLPISRDAVELLSGFNDEDNSTFLIALGLKAKIDTRVAAYFDAFKINHEIEHKELFQKQKQMLQELDKIEPEVRSHQGVELSFWTPHLNEFSTNPRLYDYDSLHAMSGYFQNGRVTNKTGMSDFIAAYFVDQGHSHGGLMALNHMFGTGSSPFPGTREEFLDTLLLHQVWNVDILEVGYRNRGGKTLPDYCWIWDELAKNQIYLTGIGTTDNHGGLVSPYSFLVNNFVTWNYAGSSGVEGLLEGMRRGRLFFGDITIADPESELLLKTPQGFVMGQIIITDKERQDLNIFISGISAGDTIYVVEQGEKTSRYISSGTSFEQTILASLDSVHGNFVRVEVYSNNGIAKLFSNPIYFVRELPEAGVSPYKAGIDIAGVFSVDLRDFSLTDALRADSILRISGAGDNGRIILDFSAPGAPSNVIFHEPVTGNWFFIDSLLILEHIQGKGDIDIDMGVHLIKRNRFKSSQF